MKKSSYKKYYNYSILPTFSFKGIYPSDTPEYKGKYDKTTTTIYQNMNNSLFTGFAMLSDEYGSED